MARFVALSVLLSICACGDGAKKLAERQRALDEQRALAKAQVEANARPAVAVRKEPVRLELFWDDPSYLRVGAEGACPEGLWALFPGDAPGEGEVRKSNEARRKELAKRLREATFLSKFRAAAGVELKEFDAPKGEFPLELAGSVDCTDSAGRVTIAFTAAKAVTPPNSASKEDAEVQQNLWSAPPLRYAHSVRGMEEAKQFKAAHQLDLAARVVYRLGQAEVDKKRVKIAKVTEGEISIGGGYEDWGAGRLLRAEVLGVRVATNFEKTPLVETRGK